MIGQLVNQPELYGDLQLGRTYKTIGKKTVFVPEYTDVKKGDWIYNNNSDIANYCEGFGFYYTIAKRDQKILTIQANRRANGDQLGVTQLHG